VTQLQLPGNMWSHYH